MNDEKLIELVRNYKAIYDLTDAKYMDNNLKILIWNKIGKEMNVSSLQCKARWNNIRDNYRKSLKKSITKSRRSATEIKHYKYSDQLSFLKKYFTNRESKGNTDSQKVKENPQDDVNDEVQPTDLVAIVKSEEDVVSEPTVLDYNSQCLQFTTISTVEPHKDDEGQPSVLNSDVDMPFQPGKRKTRKPTRYKSKDQDEVSPPKPASLTLIEYLINSKEQKATLHPVDAFLAAIAPTLKSFTPYYLNSAKSEIFSTVQAYEMQMLEQQSHQGRFYVVDNIPTLTSNFTHSNSSVSSSPSPVQQECKDPNLTRTHCTTKQNSTVNS